MFRYDTFQIANNKGADQYASAQAGLMLAISKKGFYASRPILWLPAYKFAKSFYVFKMFYLSHHHFKLIWATLVKT